MLYVTSYNDPDIDCIACVIGYVELLNLTGVKAKAIYSGETNLEVNFVKQFTGYFPIEKHLENYTVGMGYLINNVV